MQFTLKMKLKPENKCDSFIKTELFYLKGYIFRSPCKKCISEILGALTALHIHVYGSFVVWDQLTVLQISQERNRGMLMKLGRNVSCIKPFDTVTVCLGLPFTSSNTSD
jgi:hypothetical protein